jgi:hypothetical protein
MPSTTQPSTLSETASGHGPAVAGRDHPRAYCPAVAGIAILGWDSRGQAPWCKFVASILRVVNRVGVKEKEGWNPGAGERDTVMGDLGG